MVLSEKYGVTLDIKPCRVEAAFHVASDVTSSVTSSCTSSNSHVIGWRHCVLYVLLMVFLLCKTGLCTVCSQSTWTDYHWYIKVNTSSIINQTLENSQCLIVAGESIDQICEAPKSKREKKMREARTKFCDLPLYSVLSKRAKIKVLNCAGGAGCFQSLRNIETRDNDISKFYCAFQDVLDRYDCRETYSVTGNCTKCKRAYKEWLCSVYLDYYYEEERVLPCMAFCEQVAESCPFFRPNVSETQVGEPGFICKDSYIAQNSSLLYGRPGCCYLPCQSFGPNTGDCPALNLTSTCSSGGSASLYRGRVPILHIIISLLVLIIVHRTVLRRDCIGLT